MSELQWMNIHASLENESSQLQCPRTQNESAYAEVRRLPLLNSYIQIALDVLKNVRRPLTPQAILDWAYMNELVPSHLHGKTQHKTLHARLSEDIVRNRNGSLFFRTEPGVFFLSEFLNDSSIPESYRRPITARRRIRELHNDLVLSISGDQLIEMSSTNGVFSVDAVLSALDRSGSIYKNPKQECTSDTVFVWSTAVVRRKNFILSYRVGRYRDQRDSFLLKRSVGFSTMVESNDRSLFSEDPYGIAESGVKAAKIDLDIDGVIYDTSAKEDQSQLRYFLAGRSNGRISELTGIVFYECPQWFEPTKRRLAMYDVQWLDLRQPVNDLSDFDPWSQSILKYEFELTPLGST